MPRLPDRLCADPLQDRLIALRTAAAKMCSASVKTVRVHGVETLQVLEALTFQELLPAADTFTTLIQVGSSEHFFSLGARRLDRQSPLVRLVELQ